MDKLKMAIAQAEKMATLHFWESIKSLEAHKQEAFKFSLSGEERLPKQSFLCTEIFDDHGWGALVEATNGYTDAAVVLIKKFDEILRDMISLEQFIRDNRPAILATLMLPEQAAIVAVDNSAAADRYRYVLQELLVLQQQNGGNGHAGGNGGADPIWDEACKEWRKKEAKWIKSGRKGKKPSKTDFCVEWTADHDLTGDSQLTLSKLNGALRHRNKSTENPQSNSVLSRKS